MKLTIESPEVKELLMLVWDLQPWELEQELTGTDPYYVKMRNEFCEKLNDLIEKKSTP